MTNRDRLIELLKKADQKCADTLCVNCPAVGNGENCLDHLIADHLLANGVIVPPCKVGDPVYVISKGNILPFTVNRIIITNYIKIKVDYMLGRDYEIKYLLPDHFGKTVFLTKEEAEAKLKEREGKE